MNSVFQEAPEGEAQSRSDESPAASDGSAAPFVRFRGVQKSYDGQMLAVSDLNFEVARGEFLTLLGPSGSGKTTSLMMLAGFETATDGEIFIGEKRVNDIPPHKRGVGMVFQNYALFPHMTVAENVAFPLSVRRMRRREIDAKVVEALEMVRLDSDTFADRRPGQLSGGQQQRVALARALVFGPELVLMDEPLGALDRQLREHMQYEIKHLHEERGFTIVYVTHDQTEALTMSDRVAVFNEGRIRQIGRPDEIYEKPNSSFVAQFIGENNRLPGVVEFIKDGYARARLADGTGLAAVAANISQIGQATQISVRPERVEISPKGAAAQNRMTGIVRETVYLGDHLRLRLSVAGSDEFIVKARNALGAPRLSPGAKIEIGFSADDCRALDPPNG